MIPGPEHEPTPSGGVAPRSIPTDDAKAGHEAAAVQEVAKDSSPRTPGGKDNRSKPSNETKKKIRPESISELFEYAYGEAGRKLNVARDLTHLTVEAEASQSEVDLVRKLAAQDPFLEVPPDLLAAAAELRTKSHVLGRILELVLVALASHKLFEGTQLRLLDPTADPPLTAREISSIAKTFTFEKADAERAPERRAAMRDRVRVNAITAFELLRVLRDDWTADQFIQDMSILIWDTPLQRNAPKMAALLATAKNTDALSQLSRHFELLLLNAQTQMSAALRRANELEHRAEYAEARVGGLIAELDTERLRLSEIQARVDDLAQQLDSEQSNRLVDKSHLVDDYEALRTQVIRQLASQVDLLSDGLHAIRNGQTAVAEEFVDRAMRKIDGEVKRLRELDGGEG